MAITQNGRFESNFLLYFRKFSRAGGTIKPYDLVTLTGVVTDDEANIFDPSE